MTKVMIEGMGCQKCVMHVTEALEGLGVKDFNVSLEDKCATFDGAYDEAALKAAIDDAGFEVKGIE